MLNFLAIDTSSSYLTVAVQKGDRLSCTYLADCAMNHSVRLLPAVEETLQKADAELSDMDFFAVSVGAGSFTGIRIGLASVKGFCAATGKRALPITSFDAIAYNVESEKTLAVLSAGHAYYYACGYRNKQVVLPPAYLSAEAIEELGKEYALCGFENLPFASFRRTDAAAGFVCAVREKGRAENLVAPEDLVAVYVRRSQAEENRK